MKLLSGSMFKRLPGRAVPGRTGGADDAPATIEIDDPLDGDVDAEHRQQPFHVDHPNLERKLHVASKSTRFAAFIGWNLKYDSPNSFIPPLSPREAGPFVSFQHHAGGEACKLLPFLVRPLPISETAAEMLAKLVRHYEFYERGAFHDPSAEERRGYRVMLADMDLRAQLDSTQPLMEGIYPVDITQHNLDVICEGQMLLSSMFANHKDLARSAYLASVFILADNSC